MPPTGTLLSSWGMLSAGAYSRPLFSTDWGSGVFLQRTHDREILSQPPEEPEYLDTRTVGQHRHRDRTACYAVFDGSEMTLRGPRYDTDAVVAAMEALQRSQRESPRL